jgi:hypothetical protein
LAAPPFFLRTLRRGGASLSDARGRAAKG